ncbi:adenosylmethionine decarboxylase [Gymnodinialimonas sp.]
MTNTLDPLAAQKADHFTRSGEEVYAGKHLIIDIQNGHHLDDPITIEQALRDATRATGATLLHLHTHRFSPQGVTGMAILAESHIACHTWPEIGYAAFDIFMCGDTNPHAAIPILKAAFETQDITVQELHRGHLSP